MSWTGHPEIPRRLSVSFQGTDGSREPPRRQLLGIIVETGLTKMSGTSLQKNVGALFSRRAPENILYIFLTL